jgi:hypothetical protein
MQAAPAEQARQRPVGSLKENIVSTSTLEGRVHTDMIGQQKPVAMPLHDSSMGTLEHRLEAQPSHGVHAAQAPSQMQAPQAAGYNAWVHGGAGAIAKLAQPSD